MAQAPTVRVTPEALEAALQRAAARTVSVMAEAYTQEVARLMRDSPRSGRVYRRPGGRLHRASAPGEPPAPDTRRLVRSIAWALTLERGLPVARAGVRRGVDYAAALEFGTSRVAPRPAWRPALATALARATERLTGGR